MNRIALWTTTILIVLAIVSVWLWISWRSGSSTTIVQKEGQTVSVEQMALKSLQAPATSPIGNNGTMLTQLSATTSVAVTKRNVDSSTSAAALSSLTSQN